MNRTLQGTLSREELPSFLFPMEPRRPVATVPWGGRWRPIEGSCACSPLIHLQVGCLGPSGPQGSQGSWDGDSRRGHGRAGKECCSSVPVKLDLPSPNHSTPFLQSQPCQLTGGCIPKLAGMRRRKQEVCGTFNKTICLVQPTSELEKLAASSQGEREFENVLGGCTSLRISGWA